MFNFLKQFFQKSRFNEAISTSHSYTSIYGKSAPENHHNLLRAYNSEVYVYACVYIIANSIAELPYQFYVKDKEGKKVLISNEKISDLLDFPNENDENSTWYNLIEWTIACLELTGNAYWLLDKLYKNETLPAALQILLPDRMRVIPASDTKADDFVKGYYYIKDNGTKLPLTDNEIMHFKYIKPNDYFYGQGSVTAANVSIDLIREAEKTNLNMFVNGAMPSGILETDQPLNEESVNRLAIQFNREYAASKNAHKTIIADRGLKYKRVSESMKDLEFIQGLKLSRESVCSAFGVPPVLVGILDRATYSNYEQAVKIFWTHSLIPKVRRIEQVITHLVRRFEPRAFFGFDLSKVEALQDNHELKSNIATRYFNIGIPLNQIIEKLNLPFEPQPEGDTGYIPFSLMPLGTERNQQPAGNFEDPEEPEEEEGKSVKKSWMIRKEFLWKQFDNNTRKIESKYRIAVDKYFHSLGQEVEGNLGKSKSVSKAAADYLFDRDEAIKQWAKESGKFHKLGFQVNGKREMENLGLSGITFNLSNPRAVKWLETFALDKAKTVIETYHEAVKQELLDGFNAGESIADIANRVSRQTDFYGANKYYAERIAQTEIIGASNAGALEAYKQSGLKLGKGWLGALDDRIRDTHIEATMKYNEDNLIPLNADFQVGAGSGQAPGQIDDPAESCGCRCSIFSDVVRD